LLAFVFGAIAAGALPLVLGGFSLFIVLEAMMVVLSMLPAVVAIGWGWLPFDRHLPFWLFYVEAEIYLYIAPAAYVANGMPDQNAVAPIYLALQIVIVALFLVPMLVLYQRWTSGTSVAPVRWRFSQARLAAFVAACFVLTGLYFWLLSHDGLLFRRIGFQSLAREFVGLPRIHFLVIRGFETLELPLLCLLVLAVWRARGTARVLLGLSLAVVATGTLMDAALNSRLQLAFALVLPLVVFLNARPARPQARPSGLTSWRTWVAAVLVLVAVLYGFRVAANVRGSYAARHLTPEQLSPTFNSSKYGQIDNPLAFRLNGLDLMARMTPEAFKSGFSLGKSWWPSVVVELGQVVAPDVANRYKLAGATEPKWYLMREYHVATETDYPSSALTDAYGNLGPLGLLLAAAVYSLLLAAITRWARTGSSIQLVLALFLLVDVAYFEGSFIGLVLRWVAYSPATVALLVLNPMRRAGLSETNVPGHDTAGSLWNTLRVSRLRPSQK
jgi:hypothetical protein